MYKISILLPVFNVENYLEACLLSLKNQTIGFENLEIIFVDDCSTDNSFNIINDYAKQYENVKAYQTPKNSGGCGQPRNIGMPHTTAPYIMYLDPDDTYYENACEILYSNIINTNADMVSGNYIEYKDNTSFKPIDYKSAFGLKGNYLEINGIHEFPRLLAMSPAVWVKIYRKDFLIENNFDFIEYTVAEDLLFVTQCLLKAKKIVYIDVPIVRYMIRESEKKSKSLTATRNVKNLLGYIHIYNKIYDLIYEYDKELAWMASIHLYFGTRQMILSHTTKADKLDFLYNSRNLYKPFTEHYTPLPGFETICSLIFKQKFSAAISIADIMNKYLTNDEELFKKVQNREIIILYDNLTENRSNINKIINSLYKNGFDISVINLDIDEDNHIINNSVPFDKEKYSEEYINGKEFYKRFLFKKKIKFINIFEYFIKNNALKLKKYSLPLIHNTDLKNDFYITERYLIVKEYALGKIKKYNFYKVDEFNKTEIENIKNLIYSEKEFKSILSSKNIVKSKKIDDNTLLVKSIFNNEFDEEYVYSNNEKECLAIHRDKTNNKTKITLRDYDNDFKLIFNSKKDFVQYYLTQFCLKFEEKPFVINLSPHKDILDIVSTLSYEIKKYSNYENTGWLDILKESYIYSKIEEIERITNTKKYENILENKNKEFNDNDLKIKQLNEENKKQQNLIEKQNNIITIENPNKINKLNEKNKKQQNLIEKQNNIITIENPNKINKLNEENKKQQNLIEKQNKIIDKQQTIFSKFESYNSNTLTNGPQNIILNLKTTNEYYKLKNNPKKRLTLILPYLYIIYKHKNIIENIKFYRKITKNELLDIGYYLNTNTDIKRDKWCKILTPETHYTCHGFDEKRLPHPNYKNNSTKKRNNCNEKIVKEC